ARVRADALRAAAPARPAVRRRRLPARRAARVPRGPDQSDPRPRARLQFLVLGRAGPGALAGALGSLDGRPGGDRARGARVSVRIRRRELTDPRAPRVRAFASDARVVVRLDLVG